MILSDLIYIIDREMPIIFTEVGNDEVIYTINELPIIWLSRLVAYISYENINGKNTVVIYTFDNSGYVDIYLPDGREAMLWTDGSNSAVELFEGHINEGVH